MADPSGITLVLAALLAWQASLYLTAPAYYEGETVEQLLPNRADVRERFVGDGIAYACDRPG